MLALLQFDATSLAVVTRLLDEGRLPTLAALRASGVWMPLDGSATSLQSSTYPTLATGQDVAEHGLYSAFPWSAADQRVRFIHTFPRPAAVWERVTTAGRRSLVVDPILGWAPREMAGAYINGWNFEDRMLTQARSTPERLRRALIRRHGRPPNLDDVYGRRQAAVLLEWHRHLTAAPGRVAALVADMLARETFDLAWINFSAAHKAGHQFWDPASVVDEPLEAGVERTLREGLADVYVATDAAIARVIDALPADADLIVFSPTGMGANTSRADLLPGMVRAVMGGKGRRGPSGFRAPVWSLRSRVPARWRSSVARLLPDRLVADMTTRLYLHADWRRTKAVAVPGENKGYVRLNLRGREREGIVEASEAEDLLNTLVEGLATFCDLDGAPAITRVARIGELTAAGSAIDRLPDLVVYWSERPAAGVAGVTSRDFGDVRRHGVGSGRSGNHNDDAWAVLVPRSSRVPGLTRPARITDLGATVCHLMGADPAGLSGQSLLEPA